MACEGTLASIGQAAQPVRSRSAQGRRAASRGGASPALRAHREAQSAAARARWAEAAAALGFANLDDYLADRRAAGATAHRVRTELGCGGTSAENMLRVV